MSFADTYGGREPPRMKRQQQAARARAAEERCPAALASLGALAATARADPLSPWGGAQYGDEGASHGQISPAPDRGRGGRAEPATPVGHGGRRSPVVAWAADEDAAITAAQGAATLWTEGAVVLAAAAAWPAGMRRCLVRGVDAAAGAVTVTYHPPPDPEAGPVVGDVTEVVELA
eukprot:gene24772-59070_t